MLSRIETENRKGSSSTTPTLRAQAVHREVADVVAVDQHRAVVDVVEAGEQPGDRRLAAAGAPDERDGLARGHVQVEVREHRLVGLGAGSLVGERHVAELDLAAGRDEVDGTGAVDDVRGLVEDLVDAPGRGRRPLAEHHDHAEDAERRLQHARRRR